MNVVCRDPRPVAHMLHDSCLHIYSMIAACLLNKAKLNKLVIPSPFTHPFTFPRLY